MRAKDVMHRKVVVIERWRSVAELARLLDEKGITGVPVVDEKGRVVGVASQTDLVGQRRAETETPLYHRAEGGPATALVGRVPSDDAPVEQIMTPGAITCEEDTPVRDLAAAMLDRHIHRVLVTRGGKLRGIVTSMDLLRVLSAGPRRRAESAVRARPAPRKSRRA